MAVDGVGGPGTGPPPPPAPNRAQDDRVSQDRSGAASDDPFAGEPVEGGELGGESGRAEAPGADTVELSSLLDEEADFSAEADEAGGEPSSFDAEGNLAGGEDPGSTLDEMI